MIKAIIFDFDGVIADSANIKTEAMREIFLGFGSESADEIMEYHMENMGLSRYKKFQYFYDNIIKQAYDEKIGAELSEKFSLIVVNKVIDASFIKGAKEFLEENQGKYKMFIATGTPYEEMMFIAKEKRIDGYFDEIFGSPKTKEAIVLEIIEKYKITRDEIVFVGDAMSDYRAAKDTGVYFVGRTCDGESTVFPKGTDVIFDLIGLNKLLNKLS